MFGGDLRRPSLEIPEADVHGDTFTVGIHDAYPIDPVNDLAQHAIATSPTHVDEVGTGGRPAFTHRSDIDF